ncbi:restriction endonuclease subunit S [Streptococcus salivarius]|uniref:restriction endonuclease subunit S n=1 Tax=Streptococcus salivarius TaxID=1304 RepID=UPI001DC04F67|nr:restriction endonuclease subunit S [Streptococcus salivarius]
MSEWKELSSITSKIGSGLTPRGGNSVYTDNGISLIRSQNVLDMDFSTENLAYIDEVQAEKLKNVIVEKNDILLNITGDSIARCTIVPEEILPARVNQHVSIIRCKNTEQSKYVMYYLQYIKKYLLQISKVGGTRNALTKEAISKLPIKISEDWNRISTILDNIDRKIKINNQINQELEAMAKTLYDYWFVQFDFPDQNGKPYKSSGGKMVYNPELKREIPEGWGVETLRDFESKIITGKTPSRANSDNFGGKIPFITIGDIRGNTFIYSTSESLTDLGASVQQNKYLPEGSLCVSCIATVGEIGFTTEWSHTNQQINSIVFEDETHRYYLYFALKNYFENAKASAKTGNTFANMNKEDFSGIRIILPSKEIKNNFHEISEPYFAQIKCLQGQNQELTQFRDWLLPMLMNGQVKVG